MASAKREKLVITALNMFSKNGYRATGIDAILAESGVAKMTLYNHFKSKDELIIAVLNKRDNDFMQWLNDAMERHVKKQNDDVRVRQLMAFFDAIDEWIKSDSFYGCNFINACIEFKDVNNPIHAAATAHKKWVLKTLQSFLVELKLENVEFVAKQMHILIEGAIIMAVTMNDKKSAVVAKQSALQILKKY